VDTKRKFSEAHLKALSDSHKGKPKISGHDLTLDDCRNGGRSHLEDLRGQRFGHLLVLREGPRKAKTNSHPSPHWICLCELCGIQKSISANALKSGGVVSCGCKKTRAHFEKIGVACKYHGILKEIRNNVWKCYACLLWSAAKSRAKEFNFPFTIKREDIIVSEICPVLGIPLIPWAGLKSPNCPTLDRLIPTLGYVPGNICVMSFRANRLKNNATIEELEMVLSFLKNKRAKHVGRS